MTFLNVSALCLMSSLPDSQDHALEGAPEAVAWQSRGTLASRKQVRCVLAMCTVTISRPFASECARITRESLFVHLLREMFLDNDRWGCVISDRALPHADQHGGQIDIP